MIVILQHGCEKLLQDLLDSEKCLPVHSILHRQTSLFRLIKCFNYSLTYPCQLLVYKVHPAKTNGIQYNSRAINHELYGGDEVQFVLKLLIQLYSHFYGYILWCSFNVLCHTERHFLPICIKECWLKLQMLGFFDCIALLPAAPSQTTCAIGNHLVSGAHEIHRQQWKCATNWFDNDFLPPQLHLLILVYMRYSTTLYQYTLVCKLFLNF